MKTSTFFAGILFALPLALWPHWADASTAYGDLNNFDVVNDTGEECHGFEIEIDDVHSTDITYTYDWNHYGAPRITEDNSNPAHPRVIIRYESAKNANGGRTASMILLDGLTCGGPASNAPQPWSRSRNPVR